MKQPGIKPRRRRAFVTALTLIMAVCLAVVAAATLSFAMTEHGLTTRAIILRGATNAAENALNNGIGQIVAKVNDGSYPLIRYIPSALFIPANGGTTLSTPTAASFASGAMATIDPAQVTLLAGAAYSPGISYTIPVNNPTTATDQQSGQVVTSKTFPLLAAVKVTTPGMSPVTVYAQTSLCVRDQALFSYAIFYNTVPLEMAPGATMTVNGTIRSNGATNSTGTYLPGSGDFYMGGAGGTVNVLGKITASGNINYGRNPASGQSTLAPASAGQWYVPYTPAPGSSTYTNTPGIIYNAAATAASPPGGYMTIPTLSAPFFVSSSTVSGNTSAADLISMMITTGQGQTGWLADGNPSGASGVITSNWSSLAQTVTNNNVQDGVAPISISGVGTETPVTINRINQPPVAPTNSNYSAAAEAAKYSTQAGLYLVAETNGAVSAFPSSAAASAYLASGSAGSAGRSTWKTNNPSKVLVLPGSPAVAATRTSPAVPAVPYIVTSQNTTSGGAVANPISPFLDGRQNQTVTPIDIDLGNLRNVVAGASGAGAITYANGTAYTLDGPVPAPGVAGGSGWNGILYVQVEGAQTTVNSSGTATSVNPGIPGVASATTVNGNSSSSTVTNANGTTTTTTATTNGNGKTTTTTASGTSMTAVRIVDAQYVPDRSQTDAAGIQGFTLATNAPLYTLGSVNADGNLSTGSNTLPDSNNVNALGKETTVSLVSDAVTVLSSSWSDQASFNPASGGNAANSAGTEISAALLTGIVSSAANNYSGGVENYPRLLENWSNKTLQIRGSLVAMYASAYATAPWGGNYYSAATRNWGFSSIFGAGVYPPGTPILRTFRRTGFRILSYQQYQALKPGSGASANWYGDSANPVMFQNWPASMPQ